MRTDPHDREEWIIRQARERPEGERAAFLDGACGEDRALRDRVAACLAAAPGTETPTLKAESDDCRPDEADGQSFGRYKLLEKLGEGGFGAVWLAEQKEPVRRKVALKIIKLGMDTKAVVARFEAERQALAMMDHPNIAKVLDAGATEAGRPYFVMELVRGIKITEYCDQNNLANADRIALFIKVCQAIQHAHQKGIIHRDIKPSNILVTLHDGVPVPKVIDFGIAKATQGDLTEKTIHTHFQQFIGTPVYMSPEQAEMSGLDIDTRSDIYSLGVLLYELLTGKTPFDADELMALGFDAMRKAIREKEPARPSTRLATLGHVERTTTASRHATDAPRLIYQLKGDLDWIVMKCLEKDRTRRYETANGLATDLNRHLNSEPVMARPATVAYRFGKLLRRNKVISAAVALVLTAVVLATVVSMRQTFRARKELARALAAEASALAEKANAEAALHFIQDDVLRQASPGYEADRDLKVRTLLDRISDRLDRATGRPPLVEASIRQTLGSVYTELGDYPKAVLNYGRALDLERPQLGGSHVDTLRSLYGLAMAHWWGGGMAKAEPLTREGLEGSRRTLGEKHPLTLQFMQARASTLMFLGETPWPEIDSFMSKALALHREVLGPDDPATLRLVYMMSIGFYLSWEDERSVPLVEDAIERSRRVLGEKHPQTAGLITGLAVAYSNLHQLDKAEATALRCLELRRSILGDEHPLTIASVLILARIRVMQQNFKEADLLTGQALTYSRRLPIENSPFLVWHLSNLGWLYLEEGHLAKAATLCELALNALRRKPEANPVAHPRLISQLGSVRLAQHKYTEAEMLLREGSLHMKKNGPEAASRYYVMGLHGASLAALKRYSEAEPLLLESLHGLEQDRGGMPAYFNTPRRFKEAVDHLIQLYTSWGRPAQAAEWRKKSANLKQLPQIPGLTGPKP